MAEEKHYLIGGRDPIELTEFGRLSIGRNPGNKLVVPDAHVSRNHAEIYFDGNCYVLADLNSSKGTLVNGSSISTHVLQDGDTVNIGQYCYTYKVVESEDELRSALRANRKLAALQSTLDGDPVEQPAAQKDFSGMLAAMPTKAICRLLFDDERSGILVIEPTGASKVKLFFQNGRISRAESTQRQGDDAVAEAFQAKEGTFNFQASTIPITPNVETDIRVFLGLPAGSGPVPPSGNVPSGEAPPPPPAQPKRGETSTDFPF